MRFASPVVKAPTAEKERLSSRYSMYSGGETQNSMNPNDGNCVVRYISRSGCGYPSGRRITPLTIEKIAVLAPMPSASVSTATVGEARTAAQHAQPVAHVARHIVEPRQAALIAQLLHRLRHAAGANAGRARRLTRRLAATLCVLGGELEM